jgi:hypothetical protein
VALRGDVASHCLYSLEFVLASQVVSLAAVYFPKTTQAAVEGGAIMRVTLASGVRVSFCDARGCERGRSQTWDPKCTATQA